MRSNREKNDPTGNWNVSKSCGTLSLSLSLGTASFPSAGQTSPVPNCIPSCVCSDRDKDSQGDVLTVRRWQARSFSTSCRMLMRWIQIHLLPLQSIIIAYPPFDWLQSKIAVSYLWLIFIMIMSQRVFIRNCVKAKSISMVIFVINFYQSRSIERGLFQHELQLYSIERGTCDYWSIVQILDCNLWYDLWSAYRDRCPSLVGFLRKIKSLGRWHVNEMFATTYLVVQMFARWCHLPDMKTFSTTPPPCAWHNETRILLLSFSDCLRGQILKRLCQFFDDGRFGSTASKEDKNTLDRPTHGSGNFLRKKKVPWPRWWQEYKWTRSGPPKCICGPETWG